MKNIINYPINFANIKDNEKIYLYIHDDLLKNYPCKCINDKLVDIKNFEIKISPFWEDKILLTWDKEIDYLLNLEKQEMEKYLNKHSNFWIKVRKQVKEKLLNVNNYFKSKWFELVIKIWYRPVEVQYLLFKKVYSFFSKKYVKLSSLEIYEKTTEFIADPDRFIAPHTTWGAIDLILLDKKWNEVDMWCKVNFIWEKANMTTTNITDQQKNNREFLSFWMLKFWFANLASEWWHFSYWDAYRAFFYWKKSSLYGQVDI